MQGSITPLVHFIYLSIVGQEKFDDFCLGVLENQHLKWSEDTLVLARGVGVGAIVEQYLEWNHIVSYVVLGSVLKCPVQIVRVWLVPVFRVDEHV
jgi:hypothetical protein